MKDLQPRKRSPDPKIPWISPLIHVISLTVVVFFRRSFGLSYLRPISVFFTLGWVILLFSIYAWHTEGVWRSWRFFCVFGLLSVLLFFLHLLASFVAELRTKGKHDHHSGNSWLMAADTDTKTFRNESLVQLVIEPSVSMIVGLLVILMSQSDFLGKWLVVAGFSLFFKESINQWYWLRSKKRNLDVIEDAGELMKGSENRQPIVRSERQEKVRWPVREEVNNSGKLDPRKILENAALLGMEPPYTAKKAKECYRIKVAELHPEGALLDPGDDTWNDASFSDLRSAMRFFERR